MRNRSDAELLSPSKRGARGSGDEGSRCSSKPPLTGKKNSSRRTEASNTQKNQPSSRYEGSAQRKTNPPVKTPVPSGTVVSRHKKREGLEGRSDEYWRKKV